MAGVDDLVQREPAAATADIDTADLNCSTGQHYELLTLLSSRPGPGVEQYSPRMANKTIPKAGTDINLGCLESRLEKQEATVEECSP